MKQTLVLILVFALLCGVFADNQQRGKKDAKKDAKKKGKGKSVTVCPTDLTADYQTLSSAIADFDKPVEFRLCAATFTEDINITNDGTVLTGSSTGVTKWTNQLSVNANRVTIQNILFENDLASQTFVLKDVQFAIFVDVLGDDFKFLNNKLFAHNMGAATSGPTAEKTHGLRYNGKRALIHGNQFDSDQDFYNTNAIYIGSRSTTADQFAGYFVRDVVVSENGVINWGAGFAATVSPNTTQENVRVLRNYFSSIDGGNAVGLASFTPFTRPNDIFINFVFEDNYLTTKAGEAQPWAFNIFAPTRNLQVIGNTIDFSAATQTTAFAFWGNYAQEGLVIADNDIWVTDAIIGSYFTDNLLIDLTIRDNLLVINGPGGLVDAIPTYGTGTKNVIKGLYITGNKIYIADGTALFQNAVFDETADIAGAPSAPGAAPFIPTAPPHMSPASPAPPAPAVPVVPAPPTPAKPGKFVMKTESTVEHRDYTSDIIIASAAFSAGVALVGFMVIRARRASAESQALIH